jgi:hypothetical protein
MYAATRPKNGKFHFVKFDLDSQEFIKLPLPEVSGHLTDMKLDEDEKLLTVCVWNEQSEQHLVHRMALGWVFVI